MMYPLQLIPATKDYVWGGNRLKTEFGLSCDSEIAAEGWMLSCREDGPCYVTNGVHRGKPLTEVLSVWGKQALGARAASFSAFPLLIKLIDAKEPLSVQVHPDDTYALKNEGEFGKTEMWYVVDCEPNAELIYGFSQTISKEELKLAVENGTLPSVCNYVPVKPGDVFFIPAGTLHAIGGGMLIAEVQQNSNITYRVYDHGRVGTDGKPRPLHIKKALDVTVLEPPTHLYGTIGEVTEHQESTIRKLVKCDLFTAILLNINGFFPLHFEDTFCSVVCLNGSGTLTGGNEQLTVTKGSTLFVPADVEVELHGHMQLLCSYI